MQCIQVRDESEFAMSSWVLCGKSIVENSDKNLPLLPKEGIETCCSGQSACHRKSRQARIRETTAAFFDSVLRKTRCCIHNTLLAAKTAKENEVKDKQMADLLVFFPGCNKTFTSKGK